MRSGAQDTVASAPTAFSDGILIDRLRPPRMIVVMMNAIKFTCCWLGTVCALLPAKELDGVYAPVNTPCPTVEEAIKKMTVPAGYEVRNFASEPMIINPVAMTWDHRGRLWVVELYEYPKGAKETNDYQKTATDEVWHPVVKSGVGNGRDRVIILEDTDNDGKADKRTVFVEGLSLATAILCGYDGVFIGQAPNMFFFRDTNGDDKADEYKTVLTGFGLEDRHELLNSFTWGPDGWMYFTHGVFTNSKVHRPSVPKEQGNKLDAGIYRVKFENTSLKSLPSLESSKSLPEGTKGTEGTQETKGATVTGPTAVFHEVFSDGTSNPWGCDYDAAGNWFVEACVIDHLFHMAPGGLYQRQGGAPENPYAYELLPSIVQKDQPKHFRAAYAGIQVYQGGRYPKDTEGHLFFGNIHDNAIHEEAVEPVGATFKAKPIRDFLRANDGWFRPVSIQTGPDGFLWVMDWCDKYPCYQNAQANPEGVDRENGRIWRIVHNVMPNPIIPTQPIPQATSSTEPGVSKNIQYLPLPRNDSSRMEAQMDFQKKTSAELVAALSSPNSWMRRRASQAAIERNNPDDYTAIRKFVEDTNNPDAYRVQALGCFSALMKKRGRESAEDDFRFPLKNLFKEQNPLITQTALWLMGDSLPLSKSFPEFYVELPSFDELLPDDRNLNSVTALATALRQYNTGALTGIKSKSISPNMTMQLSTLLKIGLVPGDPLTPFKIWMALEPALAMSPERYLNLLAKQSTTTKPLSLILTYKSARRITDTRSAENMDLLLKFLNDIKSDDELVARALDGMLKAQEAGAVKPAKTDPAPFFAAWAKSANADVRNFSSRLATIWGDPNAIAGLMGLVLDEKADEGKRIDAIQTVRKLKSDAAKAGILKLLGTLDKKASEKLTVETLRAAAELGGMDLATAILKAWSGYSPALKSAAAEVMISRADWAEKLLDAVEGKWIASQQIPASEVPVTARRYFATQPNAEQKARATKLLGVWNETNADTKALITAKRKAALIGEPNLENGKVIFTATCATCHKFHGGGQEVGPELIGSGRSSLDALLNNIVDPNQIIGNGYENVIVNTKDNRTLAGRVVEDTPTQVTLLGIGGRREVVARGDIAKLENTHQSLMPMGFGALPDDIFRDLVWYLLAPPEEGKLTPEKKAAMAAPVTEITAPPAAKNEKQYPKIDLESVSLWNPEWKVTAPNFEGTPVKLGEFSGRKNILQMHPFPDKTTPSKLTRKLTVDATKPGKLKFAAASKDQFDWELRVNIDGKEAKRQTIGPKEGRWHEVEISLEPWKGKTVEISLENHANGWAWEFSYWSNIRVE